MSSHRCVFVGFEGIIRISNFFTSAKLKLLEVDLLLKRFGVSGWFGISSIQSLRLRVMGEKRSQTTTSDNEYIPAAFFGVQPPPLGGCWPPPLGGCWWPPTRGSREDISNHLATSMISQTKEPRLQHLHHRIIWEVVWCHMTTSSSSNKLLKLGFHPGNGPLTIATATTPPTRKKWYETKDYLLGTGSIKSSYPPFFKNTKQTNHTQYSEGPL